MNLELFYFGHETVCEPTWINDTPPNSLINSTASPKVKTTKKQGVEARSMTHRCLLYIRSKNLQTTFIKSYSMTTFQQYQERLSPHDF